MSCNNGLYFPYRMNDAREFTDYRSQADIHGEFLNTVCNNVKDERCCDGDNFNLKQCILHNSSEILDILKNNAANKSGIKKC